MHASQGQKRVQAGTRACAARWTSEDMGCACVSRTVQLALLQHQSLHGRRRRCVAWGVVHGGCRRGKGRDSGVMQRCVGLGHCMHGHEVRVIRAEQARVCGVATTGEAPHNQHARGKPCNAGIRRGEQPSRRRGDTWAPSQHSRHFGNVIDTRTRIAHTMNQSRLTRSP